MTQTICIYARDLTYIPETLCELTRQQLEDDGESVSSKEAELRLNKSRSSMANPLLFITVEHAGRLLQALPPVQLNSDSPVHPAAEQRADSGDEYAPGDITDELNRSDILAFAFANINFGLETGGHYLWLNELHVAQSRRRRGVGADLLLAVEQWARQNDVVYIACLTGSDNQAAQSMYRKNGFDISRVNWVEKILD